MPTKTARRALLPALLLLGLLIAPAARAGGDSGMAWGYDFFGQLGIGPAPDLCSGFLTPCAKHPKPMSDVSGISQIAASQNSTFAVLGDGSVRTLGANSYGQLGNGTSVASPGASTPIGLGSGVVQVAAGATHGLALLGNGTAMTWGSDESGALGIGAPAPETCESSAPCSTKPIPVPGLSDVTAVAAGSGYSVALLSNGTVVAWGKDDRGQLGDGIGISSGCKCVDHPIPVPGVSGAMAIAAGYSAAAALLSDGTVRSWGENGYGTLGNGTTHPGSTCECLGPVTASGIAGARAITAGSFYEMALLGDGSVRSWGYDSSGQLGNGSFPSVGCFCVATPAAVAGLSNVQSISAGHTHALAALGDGSVDAWGDDEDSALGDGAETDRPSPAAVAGVSGATSVSAGGITSFALTGASQTLKVEPAGAGSGTVGGPAGILCGASCSARFPQSQSEILREEPTAGSAFAGWSGACTGTAVACLVKLDGDQTVGATYGPPKGTAVSKVALNRKKRTATISFSAPGAITGYECQLVPPKPKKKKKRGGGRHGTARAAAAAKAKPYAACSSPKTYRNLKPGSYTFRVRALDILGSDEHPAVKHFVVKAPKPKRHHKK